MAKDSKHAAPDSAVAYYYQAVYSLLVLFGASDEDAVSIETRDDIQVIGPTPCLLQLKHSLGIPRALTEKNEGLWNTFSIWIPQLDEGNFHFVFVTCAGIPDGHPLLDLTRIRSNRNRARELLEQEAARVLQAATQPGLEGKGQYKGKASGCKLFLQLAPHARSDFLDRITLLHRNFNVTAIQTQVEERVANFPRSIRPLLAKRLIEWWDYRVARSLMGTDARVIQKAELLERQFGLLLELSEDNLPDDFSLREPDDISEQLGSFMEKQIELVGGGPHRVLRAAIARWRARKQRDRWISERIGIADDLRLFDARLTETWKDRHGPLCDDYRIASDGEKRKAGLALLDWSHNDAFQAVPQPRPKWNRPFLTQGTYQQLADELKVGWHPHFEALLKANHSTSSHHKNSRRYNKVTNPLLSSANKQG